MNFTEKEHSLGSIPLFEKIILQTDGSVTKILEGALDEKISIRHISKNKIDINNPEIIREVLLETKYVPLIHAKSVIYTKEMSAELASSLAYDELPLGKILSEKNIESRRIIKNISTRKNDLTNYFKTNRPLVFRTYDIIHNNKILIEITESFPIRHIASFVSSPTDIENARDKIDMLDQEITMLIAKRMKIAKYLGAIKKRGKLNIESNDRELSIIERMQTISDELDPAFLKKIFELLFLESKRIQSHVYND